MPASWSNQIKSTGGSGGTYLFLIDDTYFFLIDDTYQLLLETAGSPIAWTNQPKS